MKARTLLMLVTVAIVAWFVMLGVRVATVHLDELRETRTRMLTETP